MPTCMLRQALPKFCRQGRACFQRQRPVDKEIKCPSQAGNLKTSFKNMKAGRKRINSFNPVVSFRLRCAGMFVWDYRIPIPIPLLWGSSEGREINLRLLNYSQTAHNFILWSKLVWISRTSASFHKHLPTSSTLNWNSAKSKWLLWNLVRNITIHLHKFAPVLLLCLAQQAAFHVILAASEQKDVSLKFGSVGGVVFWMFVASLNPSCLYQWGIWHQQRPTSEHSLPAVYDIISSGLWHSRIWPSGFVRENKVPMCIYSIYIYECVYVLHMYVYIYESYGLSEVIIIFPMKMPFEGHPSQGPMYRSGAPLVLRISEQQFDWNSSEPCRCRWARRCTPQKKCPSSRRCKRS